MGGLSTFVYVRAYAKVTGITDSEHLAALFFTLLSEVSAASGGPAGSDAWTVTHPVSMYAHTFDALLKTVLNLQRDQMKGNDKPSPSSLNMCCTDGEQLVALRFRSHKIQDPLSLYWTEEAGVVLNRKFGGSPSGQTKPVHPQKHFATHTAPHSSAHAHEVKYGTTNRKAEDHGRHLIVASEPTTKTEVAEWHVVEKNSMVLRGKDEKIMLQPIGIDWAEELGLK